MEAGPIHSEERADLPDQAGGRRLHGWALAGVLAGLMLGLLLSALDQTIVGTALPTIIGDLHGFDRYTWVVTAYLLASTTMIPITGKLSDQFGRKWFLVVGVIIFLAGSALSGASQTMNQLILFRGLQGIGGGMLMALIFTLVGDLFAPAERARWQGLFSGVFALASVVGPTLGGWITDNASWRWVFYVNLPVGALALFAIIAWLPVNISVRTTQARGLAALKRIDFAGALTAAGGTVALLLGLTWGGTTYPWNSVQVIGMLVAAAVLFIAFIVVERFYTNEPILPLDLFKNQIFAVSALLSLVVGVALFAVVIYLPLFIQAVLGQSATNSGAVITPLTLTLALGAAIVGQLIAKLGRYQFLAVIGAAILAFGIFLLTQMTPSTSLGEVTRDMIVVGLGLGMLSPVLTLAVQNAIPRSRLGVGTGAVTYLRAMGQTLGTALIGAVVNNVVSSELTKSLPAAARSLPPKALAAATSQQVLINPQYKAGLTQQAIHSAVAQAVPPAVAKAVAAVPPGANYAARVAAARAEVTASVTQQVTQQVTHLLHSIFEATRLALAQGITAAFWVSLIVCVIVFVLTLFLKDVPLVKSFAPTPAVAAVGNAPTGGMRPGAPGMGIGAVPASERVPAGLPANGGAGMAALGKMALGNGNGHQRGAYTGEMPPAETRLGGVASGGVASGGEDTRSRERLAMAGVILAAIADEAQRADANPSLLAGLSALADGRYPREMGEAARGRAVARDLLEPLALTALRSAYGEKLGMGQRRGAAALTAGPTAAPGAMSQPDVPAAIFSGHTRLRPIAGPAREGWNEERREDGRQQWRDLWRQPSQAARPEPDPRWQPNPHAFVESATPDGNAGVRECGGQETAPLGAVAPSAHEDAYGASWAGHESGDWRLRARQPVDADASASGARAWEGTENGDSLYPPR